MFPTFRPALLAAVLATASPLAAAEAKPISLKKGDRIVFLGDSITQAGVGMKGYVTGVYWNLAYKNKGVDVIGAGISGNKVPDLQRRVDRDVIARKPTVVVIYIGINDVWHGQKDPKRGTSKEKFRSGLEEVIKKITDASARVVLCTPTVIGEKKDGGNELDKKLDEYADITRGIAKELNLPLCDLRKVFVDYLKEHNPDDKARGILTGDGVHLTPRGNKLVAEAILKTLGE